MFGRGGRKGAETAPAGGDAPGGVLAERMARRTRADEAPTEDRAARLARLAAALDDSLGQRLESERAAGRTPGEIARMAGEAVQAHFRAAGVALTVLELRDFVNRALARLPAAGAAAQPAPSPAPAPRAAVTPMPLPA